MQAGPQVKGLTEEIVVSPARVIELLDVGERNRRVAFTHLNANSSRSHTLFRVCYVKPRVYVHFIFNSFCN